MLRRRPRRLSLTIGSIEVEGMAEFFAEIGWTVTASEPLVRVETRGGTFGLRHEAAPPRLELALNRGIRSRSRLLPSWSSQPAGS